MTQVALVGCGTVSREQYVPACLKVPECKIKWFVDTDIRRAEELVHQYGEGQFTDDYRGIIEDVDAAIVAVPNYLHSKVSLDFLLKKRPVLCEKPIATETLDATLMVETSRRSGVRLAINYHRRRYESYRIAKQLLDSGLLGRVTRVNYEEGRVFGWPAAFLLDRQKAGGGVMIDWGSHTLDILQWLFNAKFDLVRYEDDGLNGVEANCNLELKLIRDDYDIPCNVMLSKTRNLHGITLICGEMASLEVRQSDRNGVYLRVNGHTGRIGSPKTFDDHFAEQIRSFLDPSANDNVGGLEALKNLEFIETCYKNKIDIRYPWETHWKKSGDERPNTRGRILVVGASGFLGTRLTEKLSLDYGLAVRATVHRPETAVRLARLPVELVNCDLLNPDQVMKAVSGCSVVINCAQDRSGEEVLRLLVDGTRNILEVARKCNVSKYIHISSASVLGFNKKVIDDESNRIVSFYPYVRGKIKSEKLVMAFSKVLPVVILRPTLIYGPFSTIWTTRIIERLRSGEMVAVAGDGVANLVYVDDVVDAIIQSIQRKEANGQTFIINNDRETILWKDYVQKYAEMLNTNPKISSEKWYTLQLARNFVSIVKDSMLAVIDLLHSTDTAALLANVPLAIMIGQMVFKGGKRKKLEAEFQAMADVDSAAKLKAIIGEYSRKYSMMNRQQYKAVTCRAVFSAKKAREILGFKPTPFQEGIDSTLQWVKLTVNENVKNQVQ